MIWLRSFGETEDQPWPWAGKGTMNMRYLKCLLLIAASSALFACGGTSSSTGTGVINLNGGNGGSAAGGDGGKITTTFKNSTSAVRGDLRFHAGGTVAAAFALPSVTPDFGGNPKTITVNTPVAASQPPAGTAGYFVDVSNQLFFTDGTTATEVTGLTVNAGTTLQLPNVAVIVSGAIVINGNVTVTTDTNSIDLRSNSFLLINPGGKVFTTPTGAATPSGKLSLTSVNGILVNLGTVESNGGANGGASGGVTLEAGTFIYNTGTVSAKGGSNAAGAAGSGGQITLIADTASFLTNGTIDASGGKGTSGSAAGGITILAGNKVAAPPSNAVGRAVIGGTLTSKGGEGTAGNGGAGADISLNSFSGAILVNVAAIDASGGNGSSIGGPSGNLLLNNFVGDNVTPEGIKVAGNITLNGGNGDQGGIGGTISLASGTAPFTLQGFGNVEFFGYQSITLNGGATTSSTGGVGGTVHCVLGATQNIVGVDIPAGVVFNEVPVSARGGDVAGSNGTGGHGGQLTFTSPFSNPPAVGAADPLRSLATNSAAIDVSGGAGTPGVTAKVGGTGGTVTISSYGLATIAGSINARGGAGTTNGGGGGVINLISTGINVVNSATLILSGGDGATGGNGGIGGTATLSAANQTLNSAAILANGGNSNGGTGGNGGVITLSSGYGSSNSGSRNVARGTGGSAKNGFVTVDGVTYISPDTPNSSGVI